MSRTITHISAIIQRAWRTERWKLIVSAKRRATQLYVLAADPGKS